MAGIAAMVLTYVLGTAMGLNNTATFMSSCVAFVAVSLWTDSRITRLRRRTARGTARDAAREAARGSGTEAGAERAAERTAEHGPYRDPS
ncbi:hypothetical protein [Pseudarthrobacter sp. H2]|uniref:hypothetical protein n=1 Tax=Pseudarthrobacter sp. H2 TaxID=3418415 RepID=UPI003CF7D239